MNTPIISQQSSDAEWHYDMDADVLYLSLGKPSSAVGVDIGDGLVLRLDEERNEVVEITVIGLRRRMAEYEAT